jgi:hypothetical protein
MSGVKNARRYEVPPGLMLDPRQRYDIREAAAILRQSVSRTWADIRQERLQAIRDGGRTYVSGASLIRRSAPSDVSAESDSGTSLVSG